MGRGGGRGISPIAPLHLPYISPIPQISPLYSSPARCTTTATRRTPPGAGGGKSAGHLPSPLTSLGVSLGG